MGRSRSTLFLLLGILLLGGVIWVQEMWRAKGSSKESSRIRLFELNTETLVSLQFVYPSNVVVECVKENGVWMTGSADSGMGRADVAMMHELVARLNSLGKGTVITPEHLEIRGLDASEYGFDQPVVEIIAVDNRGWHHWLVGRETPLGDMVYVKEGNGDEIYTVLNHLLTLMPPKQDSLRDRTLFPGSPAGVQRIEIRGSTGFIQLLRDANAEWVIQQPLMAPADSAVIDEYLATVYQLRVEEFVAENVSDFSVYGLQSETRQISLGSTDGTSRMLIIGDAVPDRPELVYARRTDDTTVFLLNVEVLELLDVKSNSMRDVRVLPFPASGISYLSISRGPAQFELAADESGRWSIVKPVVWDADPRAVADLIRLWDTAVITEFAHTNTSGAAEWVLLFGSSDLGQTNRIEVLPQLGDLTGLRIRREGDPSVCQINLPFLPDTMLDPLHFRERRLWHIRPDEIQKITVEGSLPSRQVVERLPDGTFAPGETNSTVRVNEASLEQLLTALTVASTDGYVAYNPHDLSIYGLADPSVVLHMGLAGTNRLGRVLLVGQEAAEGYYAMVQGQDVVFLLDKAFVEILSSELVVERETAAPVTE